MYKKKPKDLDKYLQKFAVEGQEKLVDQIRKMMIPGPSLTRSDAAQSTPNQYLGRNKLFEVMSRFKAVAEKYTQPQGQNRNLWFELLCKPINWPENIEPDKIKSDLQADEVGQIKINDKQLEYCKIIKTDGDKHCYSMFVPETGIFYSRTRTRTAESTQKWPDIFDPKAQSITIAESLIFLGKLYQKLGLNYYDRLDILFRYHDATDLAIGSIGSETFLPSAKYKKEELTFYVVRQLHELLGQTAETTAEIIIEILKKLHYQGIVNKDFFIHAVSKNLAAK